MATRQYIGARYVPKFFEGEGGSTEWVSGIPYESLTIVTYLGNSYTSKKAVPVGVNILNTEYWVATGAYNSQIETLRQALTALEEDVETIPHKKRIIVLGDSYAQGIGTNKALGAIIGDITGWDNETYYAGGCGYLRENAENKKMIDVVNTAIATADDPLTVTDVILSASVYNDSGLSSDPSFTEANFATQLTNCVTALRNTFTNAIITVIPGLWVTSQVNSTLINISTWLSKTANKLGCNYDRNSLNWLQVFTDVTSTDNVHPNASGYNIIASHIASVVSGCTPSLIDASDAVATATEDAINVRTFGNMVHIYGTITRESGQTFTNLCQLPSYCQRLVNTSFNIYNYGSQEIKRGLILSRNMIVASDQLTVGATYIIDFVTPLCTYNA